MPFPFAPTYLIKVNMRFDIVRKGMSQNSQYMYLERTSQVLIEISLHDDSFCIQIYTI